MKRPRPTIDAFKNTVPANGKEQAQQWFHQLRDNICAEFEAIESEYTNEGSTPAGQFTKTPWDRPEGGGGEISIMRGQVFEKVGVNISTVHSQFSEQFLKEMPGEGRYPYFWASGISLVAHMHSPLVPAVHMNTRMIVLSDAPHGSKANQQISWFGGGADLTPIYADAQDTADFHQAFKAACDKHDPAYHPNFKAWCDEYFYLPHRDEPRGIGGIFYDYLSEGPANDGWQRNFDFTQDVGKAFLSIFPELVRRHMLKSWTDEQRAWQLEKRGRYVEFNLLHDRGTRFGLMTGGNTEAILMSLPPEVTWK